MDHSRKNQLNADIYAIWKALTNPEIIVVYIPEVQLTETIDEDHFKGTVSVKNGQVIAKFRGEVEFSKRDSSTYEPAMMGKGADINGKRWAAMNRGLTLNELEKSTEAYCKVIVLLEQENWKEKTTELHFASDPVKATSLVSSVIVSKLKR